MLRANPRPFLYGGRRPPMGNLQAWFNARRLPSVSPVVELPDYSGFNRTATQANPALRADLDPVGINGRQALRFTAASLEHYLCNVVGGLLAGAVISPFTILCVMQVSAVGFDYTPYAAASSTAGNTFVLFRPRTANIYRIATRDDGVGGVDTSLGVSDTNPHILLLQYDGALLSAYVDGTALFTNAACITGLSSMDTFAIGALNRLGAISAHFDGWIGELLVYIPSLSLATAFLSRQYLSLAWGIAL